MDARRHRSARVSAFVALALGAIVAGLIAVNWGRVRVAVAVTLIDRDERCPRHRPFVITNSSDGDEPARCESGVQAWWCSAAAAATLERLYAQEPMLLVPYADDERLARWWATPQPGRSWPWLARRWDR